MAKGVNKKSNNFLLTPSRKFDTLDENQGKSEQHSELSKMSTPAFRQKRVRQQRATLHTNVKPATTRILNNKAQLLQLITEGLQVLWEVKRSKSQITQSYSVLLYQIYSSYLHFEKVINPTTPIILKILKFYKF